MHAAPADAQNGWCAVHDERCDVFLQHGDLNGDRVSDGNPTVCRPERDGRDSDAAGRVMAHEFGRQEVMATPCVHDPLYVTRHDCKRGRLHNDSKIG